MITQRDDYLSLLYKIQDPNRQHTIIELPPDEPVYNIDLNTRTIEAPKILSVEYDHAAETIYFAVDRYFDNQDLAEKYCVIQYQNANPIKEKGGYIYKVPYFDLVTKSDEGKMLFEWKIEGPATAFSGTVEFAIKFYEVGEVSFDTVGGETQKVNAYLYVLNTQPAKSKVLHGMDVQATSENYYFESTEVDRIYQMIEEVRRANDLYWIVLGNEVMEAEPSSDYPIGTINKNNTITDLITE